jgi:hypothetical protein
VPQRHRDESHLLLHLHLAHPAFRITLLTLTRLPLRHRIAHHLAHHRHAFVNDANITNR